MTHTPRRHLCDDRCVCPVHGTPLVYWPAGDEHACQDPDCEHAHGLVPFDLQPERPVAVAYRSRPLENRIPRTSPEAIAALLDPWGHTDPPRRPVPYPWVATPWLPGPTALDLAIRDAMLAGIRLQVIRASASP